MLGSSSSGSEEVGGVLESISVKSIFGSHLATLRDRNSGQLRRRDVALHFGLPVIAASLWIWKGPAGADLGNAIAGLSLITGLFLALIVFIFGLRLDIEDRVEHQRSTRLIGLIDATFHSTVYAALVCGVATAAAIVTSWLPNPPRTAVALVIALGLHVGLAGLLVVNRAHTAYGLLIEDKKRARRAARV